MQTSGGKKNNFKSTVTLIKQDKMSLLLGYGDKNTCIHINLTKTKKKLHSLIDMNRLKRTR